MRIDVTQADIEHGNRDECKRCPIARAINRATGGRWVVDGFYAWKIGGMRFYGLPMSAQDFVDSFDNGEFVCPFSFDLDLEGVAK